MHGLITVSIVFSSLIWLNLASIPYNDFHIKLIKTDGEVGQFETMLRQSMTTRKNFFARDDVKLITTGVSAVLKTVIGPLAATLPMIQSSLGKESDWKEPLIKTIASSETRALIQSNLDNLENESNIIADTIADLNVSLHKDVEPTQKSDVEKMKDIASTGIVQNNLKTIISRFSSGNSLFRKYPEIAVGPLLGLSALIGLFAPIRDAIYENKTDDTIISCQLTETLKEYFLPIINWRLKNVKSISTSTRWQVPEKLVYEVTYEPNKYVDIGDGDYYKYRPTNEVRCDRNVCNESFDGDCFTDKMQDNTLYSGYKGSSRHDCLVDYLFLVRLRVQELLDTAIELSNSTCSEVMRHRRRAPTGSGWWSFKKIEYRAIGDIEGNQCDNALVQLKEKCDVYIRIYINDKMDYETPKHENQDSGSFTFNYRTPKVSKKTPIRFEMWDDDSGFLGSNDDLLLSKTLTFEELIKQRPLVSFTTPSRHNNVNRIDISGAVWKDEYRQT